MNKFGTIKSKILQKLTEAYANGDKVKIKEILTSITKDADFKSMYMFYEDMENKYFENKEDAKLFLEEISPMLESKTSLNQLNKFCKSLDKKLGDVTIVENELYSNLDILSDPTQLKNVDKKILAKTKLIEHLTTKKEIPELVETKFSSNENLLHAVLANNFNVLYDNTLNEKEKKQLTEILSISDEDLKINFNILQEEVTEKISDILKEEKNTELLEKLSTAHSEAERMKPSKLNYYKLQMLKSGL
jgi:hypothetical protein